MKTDSIRMGFDEATASILTLWFLAGSVLIGIAGTRMARFADRLADRSGLGEAVTGAVLLGISTSLPGITASVTAAVGGYPTLAVANAMGGIAAQTAFLAVADLFHREANLEHAAASAANLTFATLLIGLLSLTMIGLTGPGWTLGHVDVVSVVLLVAYIGGLHLAIRGQSQPMWQPRRTAATREDTPDPDAAHDSLGALMLGFTLSTVGVLAGGVVVARTAAALVDQTTLTESLAGGLFTAVSTSLPELITTVAAVRRGALTMAVSDIVGGNAFDVLFVAVADVAFVSGSIYTSTDPYALFITALAVLLNVVVLLGLLQRQPHGPAGIGFESVLVLVLYVVGIVVIATSG